MSSRRRGLIPQAFINDLIARVDIVDVVEARVQLKKSGGKDHVGLCPFHDEKTPSFSVSSEKQFYYCFGCHATGTALTFIKEFDGLEFVEAVEALARQLGVEVPREGGDSPGPRPGAELYEVLTAANRYFQKMLREHDSASLAVEYLRGRGVSGVIARDFSIGFAPEAWDGVKRALEAFPARKLIEAGLLIERDDKRTYDRFRGRVMFPIKDTRGRVIGFGGRVLDKSEPKYLNSPETPVFSKGRELYGLFDARRAMRQLDKLIVVEGYMDVIALAQHGFPQAVATLGTATNTAHYEAMFRYTDEVVCCFDGDRAGRQAAWRALDAALGQLKEGRRLRFVFLPDGEDPDTLVRGAGATRMQALLDGAVSAGDYLFDRLREGLDLRSMDDRARFADLVLPYLDKLPAGLYSRMMRERLAVETATSTTALGGEPQRERRPQPVRHDRGRKDGAASVSERLLSMVLQRPAIARETMPAQRDWLTSWAGQPACDASTALLAEVLDYLAVEQDADTGTLLARWIGDERYGLLGGLADREVLLDDVSAKQELGDGFDHLAQILSKTQRRAEMQLLHENGTSEALKEYMRLRTE